MDKRNLAFENLKGSNVRNVLGFRKLYLRLRFPVFNLFPPVRSDFQGLCKQYLLVNIKYVENISVSTVKVKVPVSNVLKFRENMSNNRFHEIS